jgi:ubiquinone/menaquinone biosynthesis C-methylase UbiE
MHREAQAMAFDSIGERYDLAFPHKDGQVAAGEWLIGQLAGGSRVLDAGCGTGVPTMRQLQEAGLSVTGIDISGVMLALARQNVPEADLRQLDLTEVSTELGRFDAVVAFFSLLMLPRADIPGALARLYDVLSPGGLLAIGMVEACRSGSPVTRAMTSGRSYGTPGSRSWRQETCPTRRSLRKCRPRCSCSSTAAGQLASDRRADGHAVDQGVARLPGRSDRVDRRQP